MARSAKLDPIETFRFDVRIVSVSLNPVSLANNLTKGGFSQFARAGFSSVTIPETTVSEIQYRENTDNFVLRKIPGFARFGNIRLGRGVLPAQEDGKLPSLSNKDFYNWITKVNGFNPALSLMTDLTGIQRNTILRQSENFRKDMIIIARDRDGRAAKRWYVVNAWPSGYKGCSDLDAFLEEKAIENLTITSELIFELPSVLDAAKELITSVVDFPGVDLAADLELDLGF